MFVSTISHSTLLKMNPSPCSALMSFIGTLSISDGVETLENSAFWNDHFTGTLVIPASVKKIGGYAFEYSQFDTIVFEGDVTE